jgi:hypothetical protein
MLPGSQVGRFSRYLACVAGIRKLKIHLPRQKRIELGPAIAHMHHRAVKIGRPEGDSARVLPARAAPFGGPYWRSLYTSMVDSCGGVVKPPATPAWRRGVST